MPFVPAPNIVMAEIRALSSGQKIENRIMIDVLAAPSPAVLSAVATTVYDWARDVYFPLLPVTIGLVEVVATDMSSDSGGQVSHSTGTVNGGVSSGPMPNEVTLCASLRSDARGRSARGRLFILGLSRGDMADANTVEPTSAAAFIAALDSLNGDITASEWLWSVVSYRHNKVPRPGGPVYYPITNIVFVDRIVDSQRRRKPGVGS